MIVLLFKLRLKWKFEVPVVTSVDASEWELSTPLTTIFVLEEFSGPIFEKLHSMGHRILGPTALRELAEKGQPLPNNMRPLYTLSMKGTVLCFTGFRKKEEVARLVTLTHHMGGSVRKEMSATTHLVANKCGGERYQYAMTFRVPVMAASWIHNAWAMRPQVGFSAVEPKVISENKLKIFQGARVCFLGFSEDEHRHVVNVLLENGGVLTDQEDPQCTHLVCDDRAVLSRDQVLSPKSPSNSNPAGNHQSASVAGGMRRRSMAVDETGVGVRNLEKTYLKPVEEGVSYSTYLKPKDEGAGNSKTYLKPKLEEYGCGSSNSKTYLKPKDDRNGYGTYLKYKEGDCEAGGNLKTYLKPKDEENLYGGNSKIYLKPKDEENCYGGSSKSEDCGSVLNSSKTYLKPKDEDIDDSDWPASPLIRRSSNVKFSTPLNHVNSVASPSVLQNKSGLEDSVVSQADKTLCQDDDDDDSMLYSIRRTTTVVEEKMLCKKGKGRPNVVDRERNDSFLREEFDYLTSICPYPKELLEKRSRLSICLPGELSLPLDSRDLRSREMTIQEESASPLPRKRRKTLSPKKTPKKNAAAAEPSGGFKTPVLSSIRRSLRLKSVNQLARWFSNADIPTTGGCNPVASTLPPMAPGGSSTPNARALKMDDGAMPMMYTERRMLSVVDESSVSSTPSQVPASAFVVKAEWFWASVQNEGCVDEKDHLFEDYLESLVSPSRRTPTSLGAPPSAATPVSVGGGGARTRKRKRHLQEVMSRMVHHPSPATQGKRRSSISDAGLSCTPSPTQPLSDETESLSSDLQRLKHLSPRHQVFLELVQTESNYVGILSTIETLFKEQLEKMVGTSDELLNPTELKIIFGHLTPIYLTHRRMLDQLRHAAAHWQEDVSIGNIFLKFAPDLLKTYPPFVNFFENTREMLLKCDAQRQRFHAFLKVCQMKPECGRQSLQELLIRPIQRLASVMLLLNDILKHTPKGNLDHVALESALNMIREVMTHINEDKRRTECQLAMFDIFNDIDNCPPHLVSSHRSFIARCDVNELSDSLSGRGDSLAFFLFSDILEICKKRSKAFSNSLKSPNTAGGTAKLAGCKSYKHIRLMPLSTIKRVFDVKETEECHKMFALMCKANQDLKEKIYSFVITSEETDKMVFLKQLCRQMANTVCRADAENFLASLDPEQLDIDTSEVGLGTLGKAFKFASRTRMRVGRAFSFNKTPSKLKRAVSSVMSPFGSSSNLTPASQLAQMRLASCNNLNELGSQQQGSGLPPPQYPVPMSVQPQRRAKQSATLSVASLRRL
ncbi:protein ECT2 isoform X4 [Nilaparvata lugens]|uniref:protein ECT2 isoform X4 n=1 Tax=Nilaparvata lugens TaxID=108931 RepID=UPI00193E9733|nr:protein ECT2 isoform X4 [Nilaparvata lugens]